MMPQRREWQPTPIFSSVQFISITQLCLTLRPHESQHARPPLSITNSQSSPRLTSIESVMPSSHLILCRPLLLLPPIPPSIQGLQTARFLCPWNSPGKNAEVSCHFLLQGIFLTQGLNLMFYVSSIGRRILYHCATWEAQKYSYDWTVNQHQSTECPKLPAKSPV